MNESAPLPVDAGVLIALVAATGDWECLSTLECSIIVTQEVRDEIRRGPPGNPGVATPMPPCMSVWPDLVALPPWLRGVLDDGGEASVIALALEQGWSEVAIDETVGRLVAQTCSLRLTGSLGLLIRAKRKGFPVLLSSAIPRIRAANIWLGSDVERVALRLAGEA